MGKGIKCRSLLNLKVVKASYRNKYYGGNENSFEIKMEKIKHGYLTKQLTLAFKFKMDTTVHSYLPSQVLMLTAEEHISCSM